MVQWIAFEGLTDYEPAAAEMESLANRIATGDADEAIWLLEHPPLYTAGTSAKADDLTNPERFPVYRAGRGGQYTYHGPGQRVVYAMLDLGKRGRDVRRFVERLEGWAIAALAEFGVNGSTRDGRVGVWVTRQDRMPVPDGSPREDKIAAIGVKLRRWVTFHGLSINVDPDLTHYEGIVPCGIREHGVTSLADLGIPATIADLDVALKRTFETAFRPGSGEASPNVDETAAVPAPPARPAP